jgi:hypothetical protein
VNHGCWLLAVKKLHTFGGIECHLKTPFHSELQRTVM